MKILHVGDLHQGMQSNSWPDPRTGIPSRVLDVANCWKSACRLAWQALADVVVVAGDVFHEANPDATSLALFRQGLGLLEEAGIPALLVAGNHDRAPHPGRPSVLEAFQSEFVTVVTRPVSVEVAGIRFACLPSVSRHQLMSQEYTSYVLDADEQLVDGLRRILDGLRGGDDQVLIGHWPVVGSMLGVEKDIAIIPEPMLLPSDIEGPWSYVAMGHIHKRQPFGLGESTLGGYCGSIDRMNFGEEGEPKGGWIYEDGKLSPFDTPARTFITVDLDTVSFTELEQDPEGAIIRIRGSYDEWADKAEVARKLFLDNGAALVRVDLQRTARVAIRSAAASDAPGPLEALDVYLEHREVPEDDRPPIRSRARDLVGGAA